MANYLDEIGLKTFYDIINTNFVRNSNITNEISIANYYRDSIVVSSVTNIPVTKRLVIANINKNESLSIQPLPNGYEIHIIINNTSLNTITVSIPQTAPYTPTNGDVLNIKPNEIQEINIISDSNKYYIRIS